VGRWEVRVGVGVGVGRRKGVAVLVLLRDVEGIMQGM
jgi:hypothetical protein